MLLPLSPQDTSGWHKRVWGGGEVSQQGPRTLSSACEISLPTCGPAMSEPLQANTRRAETVTLEDTLWATHQRGSPVLCPGQDPRKGLDQELQGAEVKSASHRRNKGQA